MPAPSAVSHPATPVGIAAWVHCHNCDYPLIGLPSDGRCPECGTPASESTQPSVLRQLPPECVVKLHRSTGAMGFALVASTLSLLALAIGWEVLCLTGPVLILAAGLTVMWTDLPARRVTAAVELAAHTFATSIFVIPLLVPFLAAVASGVNSVVSSGLPYYDEDDWVVLALGRFFIGLAAGMVPFFLVRPVSTYARLIGEVLGDHPGPVTPRRIGSIRSNVRLVQVVGAATGIAAAVERSLAPGTIAFVLALVAVSPLPIVVGQMLLILRDARRILGRARAEQRRRAQSS